MYTDARISAAVEAMVHEIDAPTVPLADIQQKIAQPQPVRRHLSLYLRLSIAAAAIIAVIFVAFPSHSWAVIQAIEQSIEARYRAALQAKGGYAPPPIPEPLRQAVLKQAFASQSPTLAAAKLRVPFTITPPAGLPHDVVSAKIWTPPSWVYSAVTHSWRIGPRTVRFIYRRSGGRSFELVADLFDPTSGPAGKYIFEAMDPTPDGRPVLLRHEVFVWRNGNQVMTAIEGKDIRASEIEAIRVAMHGVTLPRRWPHAPDPGASFRAYPATEP